MIGAIIGDIVGSRFEFDNFRGFGFDLFHKDCQFTDDTICTMAVAEWVIDIDDFNPDVASVKFARLLQFWCKRYPNPMGGYGGRFRQWIDNPVPYNSYGNGAAMRISPVAHIFNPFNGLSKAVDLVTGVSHNHPEGLNGANSVAHAIWMARTGSSKAQIKKAMQNFGYDLDFTCNQIRRTNTFNETCQVTIPQAIVCFLESDNFENAIRLAVSIGGDSDTIAAITGSIAEAFYGVPQWIKEAAMERLPNEMNILIRKFYNSVNDEKIRNK